MTLVQLRCFVAIVDANLSITQAAEKVHATQPGLSKQLRQLEDELGFVLFTRKGRSLERLTPGGAAVLEHARRVLAEAANIRAYAANQRRDAHGRLVLATTHTQARFVLPPAIAALQGDYPRVGVSLQPVADDEVLSLLSRGSADLALVSTAGAPPAGDVAVPLFRWTRQVLVPARHALARLRGAPTLAQLAAWPLVSYESSLRPDSSLQRAFASQGLEPRITMTARDADLIKTYVRSGLGVGLLAEMAVLDSDTDLRALPAPAMLADCVTWAVLPRGRVPRDYVLDLLHRLAPQLHRKDLERVLAGHQAPDWPAPPAWRAAGVAAVAA